MKTDRQKFSVWLHLVFTSSREKLNS